MPKKKNKKKEAQKAVGFLADLHIPYEVTESLEIAVDGILKNDPDQVIITEIPDMYSVSPWKRDPYRMEFDEEMELVKKGIRWLDRQFKNQKVTYILGNHDHWLKYFIWKKAPQLAKLKETKMEAIMGLDKVEWEIVDNAERMNQGLGPYKIGKLYYLHGHEAYRGWNVVNIAKIQYEKCKANVIFGHHHRCQEWIVRKLDGSFEGAWGVGCCSELSPLFNLKNDWVHGFATVYYHADGTFSVHNRKIIKGRVV